MSGQLSQRIYFKNLDVLRFLAAYMIFALHSYFGWKTFFGTPDVLPGQVPSALVGHFDRVIKNFTFGVDIFFLISGFLLTYLLLAERESTGQVNVPKFYIRRAFRIWPLYFLLILIGPLLTYFYYEQSPAYLYHFFFAGNFDVVAHGMKSPATDHLWSICIEEHFYLLCPLIMAFVPVKRIPQVLLSIVLMTIIFRGYVAGRYEQYGLVVYMHTLSRIDVLALGSLFGYAHYQGWLRFNHPRSIRFMLYLVFVLAFVFTDYDECGTFFTAALKKYVFVLLAAYWAGNFIFNADAVCAPRKSNLLHTFGKASYGIYMFNPVIIFVLLKTFSAMNVHNYFLFLGLAHVLLAGVVFLSYRFLEMPFLSLKERYAVINSGEGHAADNLAEEESGTLGVSPVTPE